MLSVCAMEAEQQGERNETGKGEQEEPKAVAMDEEGKPDEIREEHDEQGAPGENGADAEEDPDTNAGIESGKNPEEGKQEGPEGDEKEEDRVPEVIFPEFRLQSVVNDQGNCVSDAEGNHYFRKFMKVTLQVGEETEDPAVRFVIRRGGETLTEKEGYVTDVIEEEGEYLYTITCSIGEQEIAGEQVLTVRGKKVTGDPSMLHRFVRIRWRLVKSIMLQRIQRSGSGQMPLQGSCWQNTEKGTENISCGKTFEEKMRVICMEKQDLWKRSSKNRMNLRSGWPIWRMAVIIIHFGSQTYLGGQQRPNWNLPSIRPRRMIRCLYPIHRTEQIRSPSPVRGSWSLCGLL